MVSDEREPMGALFRLVVLYGALASANGKPSVVGAARCKLCHRPTYLSWEATAHRRASERLGQEERIPECLACHSTGAASLGVQCEACHGAGEFYWPAEVMLDPVKAREAGLIEPTEAVCRTCHASGLPRHKSGFIMPDRKALARSVH